MPETQRSPKTKLVTLPNILTAGRVFFGAGVADHATQDRSPAGRVAGGAEYGLLLLSDMADGAAARGLAGLGPRGAEIGARILRPLGPGAEQVGHWLGGEIGDRLGGSTAFGADLDRYGDRAESATSGVVLARKGIIPWAPVAVEIARGLHVARRRDQVAELGGNAKTDWTGKTNTALHSALKVADILAVPGTRGLRRAAWAGQTGLAVFSWGRYVRQLRAEQRRLLQDAGIDTAQGLNKAQKQWRAQQRRSESNTLYLPGDGPATQSR